MTAFIDINGYAFYNCTSLKDVTLGDSVENIRECAFSNCTSLKNINIPSSTKLIGDNAFANCYELPSINISSGVTTIGACAFYHCRNLNSVIIGERVAIIGENAFSKCITLEKIRIPGSVQTIGDEAFSYCTELRTITIDKGNLRLIGANVFIESDKFYRTYYGGSLSDWKVITIDSSNNDDDFSLNETVYFYSSTETGVGTKGNYWHYDREGREKVTFLNENEEKAAFYAQKYAMAESLISRCVSVVETTEEVPPDAI